MKQENKTDTGYIARPMPQINKRDEPSLALSRPVDGVR
jgi:hypothetical protein